MLIHYSASLDVPDLNAGLAFYGAVFGFVEVARPVPGLLVMRAGQQEICLLERTDHSVAAPGSPDTRRYTRHWTPVHLDFQRPCMPTPNTDRWPFAAIPLATAFV